MQTLTLSQIKVLKGYTFAIDVTPATEQLAGIPYVYVFISKARLIKSLSHIPGLHVQVQFGGFGNHLTIRL